MAGQGSLCQRIYQSRCNRSALGLLCALLSVLSALAPSVSAASEETELVDARLRFQWESNDARFFQVRLNVIDAGGEGNTHSISEVANHSTSDRTTGAIELSSDAQTVTIQPRHALRGGAIQFRVVASREAFVSIEVLDDGHKAVSSSARRMVKQFPLLEIVDRGRLTSESDGSVVTAGPPTWTLSRLDNDSLRIENLRDLPVYKPGEQLSFSIRASALVHHASEQLSLQ